MIDNVNVLGTFGTSDHNMLQWDAKVGTTKFYASRTVLDYRKGDFSAMKNELSKVPWNKVLQGSTEQKWATFKSILEDQISKHVPLKQMLKARKGNHSGYPIKQ